MSHPDILLPFGLPPTEMANDLLKAMETPNLAMLLGRSSLRNTRSFDPFSRSLPHERWLAAQFGIEQTLEQTGSPPLATAAMRSFALVPDDGFWFIVQPSHLHIARDHLVLTDWRHLSLSDAESRALFDAAEPLFEESGRSLLYGDAHHWFVRSDEWESLQTATPDAACGHNIDIWLPKGPHERQWRRLQNEVQMTWHMHPVNAERETARLNVVNALWLWGGASASPMPPQNKQLFKLSDASHGFSHYPGTPLPHGAASELLSRSHSQGIVVLDTLIEAALAEDWSEWLGRYKSLEESWFTPLLEGLKTGKIGEFSLIFTDSIGLSESAVTRNSLRKFWARPSLTKLSR